MTDVYRQPTWGLDGGDRLNPTRVRVLLGLAGWRPRNVLAKKARRTLHGRVCAIVGSDFRTPRFGPDLYLPHPYGIVVHAGVTIGRGCTIYQHVTIGEDNRREGVPTIGDDVVIGAGAVVLGPIQVGDGARIGANAVVVRDVPAGATAVGVPAHVVSR